MGALEIHDPTQSPPGEEKNVNILFFGLEIWQLLRSKRTDDDKMKNVSWILIVMCILNGCKDSPQNSQGEAKNAADKGTTDSTVHKLSDFHLRETLSADEVAAAVGPPARYAGSGITYFVYNLEDHQELWLRFVPQNRTGFTKLFSASVFVWKDGKIQPVSQVFQCQEATP